MNDTRPIFVFGSNLAGRHGAGAALYAKTYFGAQHGVGVGRTGHAYAIPTKDAQLRTLPLDKIAEHIRGFLSYANNNPRETFELTPVGCGLAGHSPKDIWGILKSEALPGNVFLSPSWVNDH